MLDERMDAVFQALSSEARRRILDILKHAPGSSVNDVSAHFEVSRIQVMKHLATLEAAGLVHSEKVGRTRRLFLNVVPIQMIHDRWMSEYSSLWAGKLTRLKYTVENPGSSQAGSPRTSRKRSTKERKDV
jgi:DNA-binding transcriptional ArsR family regulator